MRPYWKETVVAFPPGFTLALSVAVVSPVAEPAEEATAGGDAPEEAAVVKRDSKEPNIRPPVAFVALAARRTVWSVLPARPAGM